MRSGRKPGVADPPQRVPERELLASRDFNFAQMAVHRIQRVSLVAEVMPDDNREPIGVFRIVHTGINAITSLDHFSPRGSQDLWCLPEQGCPPRYGWCCKEFSSVPVVGERPVDFICPDRSGKIKMIVRGERPGYLVERAAARQRPGPAPGWEIQILTDRRKGFRPRDQTTRRQHVSSAGSSVTCGKGSRSLIVRTMVSVAVAFCALQRGWYLIPVSEDRKVSALAAGSRPVLLTGGRIWQAVSPRMAAANKRINRFLLSENRIQFTFRLGQARFLIVIAVLEYPVCCFQVESHLLPTAAHGPGEGVMVGREVGVVEGVGVRYHRGVMVGVRVGGMMMVGVMSTSGG